MNSTKWTQSAVKRKAFEHGVKSMVRESAIGVVEIARCLLSKQTKSTGPQRTTLPCLCPHDHWFKPPAWQAYIFVLGGRPADICIGWCCAAALLGKWQQHMPQREVMTIVGETTSQQVDFRCGNRALWKKDVLFLKCLGRLLYCIFCYEIELVLVGTPSEKRGFSR